MEHEVHVTIDLHEEDAGRCGAFCSHMTSRGWEEQEEQDLRSWVKPAQHDLLSRIIAEAVADVDGAAKQAGVASWSLIVMPRVPTPSSVRAP